MNFAGKKLNGFYNNTGTVSAREKHLIAENKKLKRKNKRLSSAMLYLVGHIETRLPFWKSKSTPKKEDQKPLPLTLEETPRKKPIQAKQKKKKIIGKTWMPENLDEKRIETPKSARRNNPLSMHQIFADKKRDRIEAASREPEVVKFPTPLDAIPEPSQIPETVSEPPVLLAEEMADDDAVMLTPALAPDEVSLLAAPTQDKKMDVIHPQPSEIIGEHEDKKMSAKEASMAYLAVSVVAKPVPKSNILTVLDKSEIAEHDALEKQVAQQNEMMRAAMLRRVNRLRW